MAATTIILQTSSKALCLFLLMIIKYFMRLISFLFFFCIIASFYLFNPIKLFREVFLIFASTVQSFIHFIGVLPFNSLTSVNVSNSQAMSSKINSFKVKESIVFLCTFTPPIGHFNLFPLLFLHGR